MVEAIISWCHCQFMACLVRHFRVLGCGFFLLGPAEAGYGLRDPERLALGALQQSIRHHSERLMNDYEISYLFGGSRVTQSGSACRECTICLKQNPAGKGQRLAVCPVCRDCGLDCSHFTRMVYERAGLPTPYLTTSQMLSLNPRELFRRYSLLPVQNIAKARSGDLLVYKGHVVLLEKKLLNGKGNIIHATGGKDIRSPGQGIQRETNVDLLDFRGRLRRILRHKNLFIQKDRP